MGRTLGISQVAARAGVEASALRFYEREHLIVSERDRSGYRVYQPHVLRRLAFITIGQSVGLSLAEIREALAGLPRNRVPNKRDWQRVSRQWRIHLQQRIDTLERMRDHLDDCVGCGCLSLRDCTLSNRQDQISRKGAGPRFLLGDLPQSSTLVSRV